MKSLYDAFMAQGAALWQNNQKAAAQKAWDEARRIKERMDKIRQEEREAQRKTEEQK